MRILGVDPGLNATGYGIIEVKGRDFELVEAGIIRTSYKEKIEDRLRKIYEGLSELIEEFKPEVMVLEKIYSHYKHPTTAILMGHARGVVCLLCGMNNIRLLSYLPTRIKKAVTGRGRASKDQIKQMVEALLKLKDTPKPSDVTDALALAIGYVYIAQKEIYDIKNLR